MFSLPIIFKHSYIKESMFDLKINEEDNRITYILTFPIKYWKSVPKKGGAKYSIHSKILYIFKTYDNNKKLNRYYIESNISSLST